MPDEDPGRPPGGGAKPATASPAEHLGRIGLDWWATIVAGVIAALAVANVLPKIPW
jgi:hypothetical protein